MTTEYLTKFFPPSKTTELRGKINTFVVKDRESLFKSWERFKDLLLDCPHHGIPKIELLEIFFKGLDEDSQFKLQSLSGGTFMEKHVDDSWEFVEKQALVIEKYSHRKSEGRKAGAYEVSEVTMSNFKLDAINNELKSLRGLCATTLKS